MPLDTMLTAHDDNLRVDDLTRAIEALNACAAHCLACADACLEEDDVDSMVRCIRSDLDCATICRATADVLARAGASGMPWRQQVEVAVAATDACAEECGSHDHDHCQACAAACRRASEACQQLLQAA